MISMLNQMANFISQLLVRKENVIPASTSSSVLLQDK